MTYSFETGCELPKNFWTCGRTNCKSICGSGEPKPSSSLFRSSFGWSSGWLKHVESLSLRRLEEWTEKASSVFLFFNQSHLSKASSVNLLSISKFKTFFDNWITSMLKNIPVSHVIVTWESHNWFWGKLWYVIRTLRWSTAFLTSFLLSIIYNLDRHRPPLTMGAHRTALQ